MKILVVRRDNIGDLVLTTPVFTALRRRFPDARIEALVNSYNVAILDQHPDVDRVHAYTKGKHLEGRGAFSNLRARLSQMARLRAERFDYVLVATPGFRPRDIRLARWLAPTHLIACVPSGRRVSGVDLPVASDAPGSRHHVEDTFRILEPLGITGAPPAPSLAQAPAPRSSAALLVAVHLSARKPSSRWPEERFAPLMRALHARLGARFRLLWSPGAEDDPRHPGDDGKSRRVLERARDLPVEPAETRELSTLVRAIAACDAIVCSDGGAMHIAAALGRPVVCLFGDSDATTWRPWNVAHRLLQPPSRSVSDVGVEEAVGAFAELAWETKLGPRRPGDDGLVSPSPSPLPRP